MTDTHEPNPLLDKAERNRLRTRFMREGDRVAGLLDALGAALDALDTLQSTLEQQQAEAASREATLGKQVVEKDRAFRHISYFVGTRQATATVAAQERDICRQKAETITRLEKEHAEQRAAWAAREAALFQALWEKDFDDPDGCVDGEAALKEGLSDAAREIAEKARWYDSVRAGWAEVNAKLAAAEEKAAKVYDIGFFHGREYESMDSITAMSRQGKFDTLRREALAAIAEKP